MGGGLGALLAMDVYEMIAWVSTALEFQREIDKDLENKRRKAKERNRSKKGFG